MHNIVCLVGRLTKDPELKTTQSGKSVCSFSLAVDGVKKEETHFIDCVAWNKTAENLAKFKKKGEQIAITGRLTTRNYEDRNGNKRKAVEVTVNDLQFIGGKSNDETPKTSYSAPQTNLSVPYDDGEDLTDGLPF